MWGAVAGVVHVVGECLAQLESELWGELILRDVDLGWFAGDEIIEDGVGNMREVVDDAFALIHWGG